MSTLLTRSRRIIRVKLKSEFQLHMACATVGILAVSLIGCRLTGIHATTALGYPLFFMAFIMVAVLAVYWNVENRPRRFESILVLPWIFFLIPMLMYPMLIAARLRFPLQDAHLAQIDHLFGVSVPSIVAWASHHRVGAILDKTYAFLIYFMIAAALLPPLSGKLEHAREFVVANLVAMAIGMTLFALLPTVGPWYPHHFVPRPSQAFCQTQFFRLRAPGPYLQAPGIGVVGFPSFHVIWAILCARALWGFRFLRPLIALLAVMIILSTMTTGWHYFSDVLGGLIVAAIASMAAEAYTRRWPASATPPAAAKITARPA